MLLVKIVSERYYPAMAAPSDVSSRKLADLVVQLSCLANVIKFAARNKTILSDNY